MNKETEVIRLSTTITPKFEIILRRHCYTMRLMKNEVLELYQQAYLREQEREKSEKKGKDVKKEEEK